MRTVGADQLMFDDSIPRGGTVADETHPQADNPYMAALLQPQKFSTVFPDGSQVPCVMRAYDISSVLQWVSPNYNMLILAFEGSPRNLIVVLLQPVNEVVWYYLTNLTLDQPLSTNYRMARLVSAKVDIKSASQAAGVFALSGLMNSVRAVSMPPLVGLTYNSVVSYATNGGYVVKGATAESGVTTLFPGKMDTEFWPPEDGNSLLNVQEVTNFSCTHPINPWSNLVMNAVANTPYQIVQLQDFVNFPDPCWGRMRIYGNVNFTLSTAIVANDCYISIGSNTRVADQVTWACTSTPVVWFTTYLPATPANTNIVVNFDFVVSSEAPMTGLQIVFNNGNNAPIAKNLTLVTSPLPATIGVNFLGLTLFDTLRDQLFGNPSLTILEQVSVGQPVSIAGTFNYQLVPNANLSRNISPRPIPSDTIYRDMASAVMATIGQGGPPMVWEGKQYDRALYSGYFDHFTRQGFAYAAAPPALAATLGALWSRVSPGILRTLKKGGLAAVKALSQQAINELPPAYQDIARTAAKSSKYLAAPPTTIGESHSSELQEVEVVKEEDASESFVWYAAGPSRWDKKFQTHMAPVMPQLSKVPVRLTPTQAWQKYSSSEEGVVTARTFSEYLSQKKIIQTTRLASFPVWNRDLNRGLIVTLSVDIVPFNSSSDLYPVLVDYQREIFVDPNLDPARDGEFYRGLFAYAVSTGIMKPYETLEIRCNCKQQISGPSSQLAILAALCGWSTHAVYSGLITWENVITPVLGFVGSTVEKASMCLDAGRPFICYPESEEDTDAILDSADEAGCDVLMEGQIIAGAPHTRLAVFLVSSVVGATLASLFSAPVNASLAILTSKDVFRRELKETDRAAWERSLQEEHLTTAAAKGKTVKQIQFKQRATEDPPGYVESKSNIQDFLDVLNLQPPHLKPIVDSYTTKLRHLESSNQSTTKSKINYVATADLLIEKGMKALDAAKEQPAPRKTPKTSTKVSIAAKPEPEWREITTSIPKQAKPSSKGKEAENRPAQVRFASNLEEAGEENLEQGESENREQEYLEEEDDDSDEEVDVNWQAQ
jgi:hypothetical protein